MSKNLFVIIAIAAICNFLCGNYIAVHGASDATNVDETLSQLEDRFFEHQYDNDSNEDRLTRLEQFIYGTTETGSVSDRLTHILSTVPAQTPANTNNDNNTAANAPANINDNDDNSSDNQQTADSSDHNPFDYSSYPRVTTLEQQILGKTYVSDALPDRLSRLETKAFGKPSTSTDLSQRVDSLDDYAQRHDIFGERSIATNYTNTDSNNAFAFTPLKKNGNNNNNNNTNNTNGTPAMTPATWPYLDDDNVPDQAPVYNSSNGDFVGSVEERVSMMEAQVFDRTHTDWPLNKRLAKLEKKVFPKEDDSSKGIADRTNKLWIALHPHEKDQSKWLIANNNTTGSTSQSSPAPIGANQSNDNQQPQKHQSWLHKLTNGVGSGLSSPSSAGMGTMYNAGYPLGPGVPYMLSGSNGYNSHYVGGTFGPGAGVGGLPFSFW